jgi:hypothetical protein
MVVPKKPKHELRLSKVHLLEALDRVAAAIGDRSRSVVLHRTGERLEIHGENPNAGELKTDIAAGGWAEKATIEINLSYLYNAARFAPSDDFGSVSPTTRAQSKSTRAGIWRSSCRSGRKEANHDVERQNPGTESPCGERIDHRDLDRRRDGTNRGRAPASRAG